MLSEIEARSMFLNGCYHTVISDWYSSFNRCTQSSPSLGPAFVFKSGICARDFFVFESTIMKALASRGAIWWISSSSYFHARHCSVWSGSLHHTVSSQHHLSFGLPFTQSLVDVLGSISMFSWAIQIYRFAF